jgi:hypothetical protein
VRGYELRRSGGRKVARGSTKKDELTLELYAFAVDEGMDSNEECHLAEKEDEVERWGFLGRRGLGWRQACSWRSSTSRLKDPLLSGINAGMFGERALERFAADGRRIPSARGGHCPAAKAPIFLVFPSSGVNVVRTVQCRVKVKL